MVRPQPVGILCLVVLQALALALPAAARKFQMSGKWDLRRSDLYLPLRFAVSAWPASATMPTPVSSFPNGPVLGGGGVVATGSAPATLRIPRHRFGAPFYAGIPFTHSMLSPGSLVQIVTEFTPDGPAASATLAPGAGPGSFTWCPGDPGCVAGGGMLSTDPPQGAGARNGRIVYRAGPNRFGGTMQMLLSGRTITSIVFQNPAPLRVDHHLGVFRSEAQHTGGSYAFTVMHYDPRGIFTFPTMVPSQSQLILYPGPFGGTGGTPIFYLPTVITTPMGFKAGAFSSRTGFPFTTGTVFAQQTTGTGDQLFTLMGSDLRSPLGAGNITLVSGGLALRHTVAGASTSASFGRVRMTLAPPIPSLSPAGLAAAGALVLLAAGFALSRRR